MKVTNSLLIVLAGIVLAGNSYAGLDLSATCKKVEFAELKTYNKKQLTELYCRNTAYEKLNSDSGNSYAELALKSKKNQIDALNIGYSKAASEAEAQAKEISAKADAENAKASACEFENERIVKILKSTPKC